MTTNAAGDFSVIAISDHGCTATSNVINIKAAAPVDQVPGGCFIKCDPLTVCLPTLTDVVSYQLFQNGTLIQSGTSWPADYLITSDGSYVFEITNSNGCVVSSDPLDVSLYPGVGSITVLTYLDVDNDGIITVADMLLPGITVQIESADGTSLAIQRLKVMAPLFLKIFQRRIM